MRSITDDDHAIVVPHRHAGEVVSRPAGHDVLRPPNDVDRGRGIPGKKLAKLLTPLLRLHGRELAPGRLAAPRRICKPPDFTVRVRDAAKEAPLAEKHPHRV